MNTMKTAMLIAFMTALFMGIGLLLGGKGGMLIALGVALWIIFGRLARDHDAGPRGAFEVVPAVKPPRAASASAAV